MQYAAFNSVVHKLLHAASCCVLGRQHLHHCMAARRAENRLRGKQVLLHAAQQREGEEWQKLEMAKVGNGDLHTPLVGVIRRVPGFISKFDPGYALRLAAE